MDVLMGNAPSFLSCVASTGHNDIKLIYGCCTI